MYVPAACRVQKVWMSWNWSHKMAVNYPVGAGNRTRVLWKSRVLLAVEPCLQAHIKVTFRRQTTEFTLESW